MTRPHHHRFFNESRIVKQSNIYAAASALFSLCLAACGGNGDAGPSINGSVQMGAVANATVSVYSLDANGVASSTPIDTATTASDGTFSLHGAVHYPVIVRATGGTYTEEATGTSAKLTEEIDAVYLAAPAQIVVSAYSNAIVVDALAAGGLTAANIAAASARVNALAGNIDVSQTSPALVSAGTTGSVSDGSKMALALGAESQNRTDAGESVADSSKDIAADAASGNTLTTCHAGAGDTLADGTADTSSTQCSVSMAAAAFVASPHNRSGITSLAMLAPDASPAPRTDVASATTCDREALLEQNFAVFQARRMGVQAKLVNGVTAANWQTVKDGHWGPQAGQYGPISKPSGCGDLYKYQRELLMAVENYWVDQGINYCHHHIPGWTPFDDSASPNPYYRNSSAGSTSGNDVQTSGNPMTCTAQRKTDRSQIVQITQGLGPQALPPSEINWNGVDCSDFTSWVYNFAGITLAGNDLDPDTGTQACWTGDELPNWKFDKQPGVLLDINSANIGRMEQYLLPGDLLYIVKSAAVTKKAGPQNVVGGFGISHVITWTGKRFSELRQGPDGWRYDPALIGQPDSRLGGDVPMLLPFAPSELGHTEFGADRDPYMILDSHYAGPAYRPFTEKSWYAGSLSNVRRIVDADSVKDDAVLAPYIITRESVSKGVYTFSSQHARDAGTGWKLVFQKPAKSIPACYRMGKAQG